MSENAGVVEVCAAVADLDIACPFNFPFIVTLHTISNGAGVFRILIVVEYIALFVSSCAKY